VEKNMSKFYLSKKGFGLMEVMAAAVVLGFLIVGLTRLQMGNREATLRIRTRDAAQIVAQQFIDSLSSVGINSIESSIIDPPIEVEYRWHSKKASDTITSKVIYTITGKISDMDSSSEESKLSMDTKHVMAKEVNLTVSWQPFQDKSRGTQNITLSRIIK
jgi:Tfp pilus assembly protein PilV